MWVPKRQLGCWLLLITLALLFPAATAATTLEGEDLYQQIRQLTATTKPSPSPSPKPKASPSPSPPPPPAGTLPSPSPKPPSPSPKPPSPSPKPPSPSPKPPSPSPKPPSPSPKPPSPSPKPPSPSPKPPSPSPKPPSPSPKPPSPSPKPPSPSPKPPSPSPKPPSPSPKPPSPSPKPPSPSPKPPSPSPKPPSPSPKPPSPSPKPPSPSPKPPSPSPKPPSPSPKPPSPSPAPPSPSPKPPSPSPSPAPVDVNACLVYPCKNSTTSTATCTDSPNPAPNSAAGRTCSCSASTSFYANDTAGCVDVNACSYWPCNQAGAGGAATCADLSGQPNSTAGRTCTCANGGLYIDLSGCPIVEVNACLANACKDGTGGASVCTDLPYPAPNTAAGRTCSCSLGSSVYADDTSGCVDVDACTFWPCNQAGAGGAATCADKTGGDNSTAGRTCTCTNGGVYSGATGCADVNACLANACKDGTGGTAICTDLPYPAPNSAAGRTCSCSLGSSVYVDDTSGCVDVDACTFWPCNQAGAGGAATCADKTGGDNSTAGRTCTCTNGGVYSDATGCADVNACLANACKDGTGGAAVCTDLPYPAPNSAAGRTCSCSLGSSVYVDDTSGCVDVDACTSWPCNQAGAGGAATCADKTGGDNSTAGRTCTCTNGGVYSDATGCADVNACLANACKDGTGGAAVCTDLPYPAPNSAAGRTCSCSLGSSVYVDDTSGCVDVDACTFWPCNQAGAGGAATCADKTGGDNSTAGRTCTCTNGGVYSGATGCADVNACLANACKDGTGGTAICTDLPYPAPNSAAGRTCSCSLGSSVYVDDTSGCVDVDACTFWPCNQAGAGGAATCADKTGGDNSTAGRTCTCTNGGVYSDATGCADVNACLANACKDGTGGAAVCTDLPYPAPNSAAGRTCSCSLGSSVYADDTSGCVDVDACTSWPCNQAGAGGAATCADKTGGDNSTAGRTCTCADPATYQDDATGCVTTPSTPTTPITYSAATGGAASVASVVDVTVAPGTFDATAGATPAVIDITTTSALDPLLSLMRARFEVVSAATKVVTISSTQQPKKPLQIKLWQGTGNPWQSSGSITLGPWDELRVSYVNAWTAKAGSSGLQGSITLELLPDRTPLDISDSITVNLPEWAFRPTANATGTYHFRADVVLTASRAAFGGRHRRLLFDGAARVLAATWGTRKHRSPAGSGSLAAVQPGTGPLVDAPSTSPVDATPAPAPAGHCSTNDRPSQQCPAGWDGLNKLFVAPAAAAVTPAAASAAGARHKQRKAPSRIPGTISALVSSQQQGGSPLAGVSAMSLGGAVSSASVSASNDTSAYCAGSALVRPVGIEYGILKPFDPELDDSGAWQYHAGIDFAVPAGVDVLVAHDGTVTTVGNDPSLGDYVVISGSAGTTLYAPITALLAAQGAAVNAGAVLGKTTATGFLHFVYTPNGDAFVMATAVDPNPCFLVVSPNNNNNGTSINGTTLPTCDPSTQPALAPNFAQLDVTIPPGSSKDVDSFLCTRGTTVASSNFDIALSVDLTGSFTDDLPIIKGLAPSLWSGLAAAIPSMRMALTVFWDYYSDPQVYEVRQVFTGTQAAWQSAVDSMVNGWGGDAPEAQLIAIQNMANELSGITWRSNAVKVMVLTTDAPFHTGSFVQPDGKAYQYGTMQQTLDLLRAKSIKFVGICQPGCDPLQMNFLASGTGGSVIMGASNSADIVTAITQGLSNMLFNIRPTVLPGCAANITFTPEVVTSVGVARSIAIREHIAVPGSVTQPVIKCEVSFSADSGELARQVVTIHTGVGGGNGTAECRLVTRPAGLSLYTARCNRTGYLILGSQVNASSSVHIYPEVGHLPSTCGSTDRQCWVYARDPISGTEGWMPHDLPNQPQKLACGYALGERYMDCCAAGAACTTRDLCVGKTCSSHGTCSEGMCYCDVGWAGDNCERTDACLPDASGVICSGNGYCEAATSSCVCKPGFSGSRCEVNACASGCSGHGTCSLGVCSCATGYSGADCSISDPCKTSPACSGHGYCSGGACVCTTGYSGSDCSTYDPCSDPTFCVQGTCTSDPPSCSCYLGWGGTNCDSKLDLCDPDPCGHNGKCDNTTGLCNCDVGWTGWDCNTPDPCSDPNFCSGHGACDPGDGADIPASCFCDAGWSGTHCDSAVGLCDVNPCSDHGKCDSTTGDCMCDQGWTGYDCSTPPDICTGDYACNGNGACNTDGECATCVKGWKGTYCELPEGPTKCMKVSLAGGLNVYSERCNRTSLVVDSLAQNNVFKWYNEVPYRNSSCPGVDTHCWIWVTTSSGTSGWLTNEEPYVLGVCGKSGGGTKYIASTSLAC